jgi:ABC-2 type transport system permease protein
MTETVDDRTTPRRRRPASLARFLGAYLAANVQAALEYRAAFLWQVLAMLINDAVWLAFWLAYFSRYPLVQGWGRDDIVMMWAVVGAGFGLGATVAGNSPRLARLIADGQLDFYLALPRPVLTHLLVSRMELTAPGDILFGVAVFGWLVGPSAQQWLLFFVFTATTACVFVSFTVIVHSLAFWIGQAEGLAGQLSAALISFSTYPTVIFQGPVKLLLFTLIPAGFIAYVPVQVLRRFSWGPFLGVLGFSLAIAIAARWIFRAGLRRYESGNLMVTRE